MNVCFVGGKEFDAKAVSEFLRSLPLSDTVVTGTGIGLEKFIREQAPEFGLNVEVPKPLAYIDRTTEDVIEWYGSLFITGRREHFKKKNLTNSVTAQVIDSALLKAGKLVIVGKGSHAEKARRAVKRGPWPGLTVVEL